MAGRVSCSGWFGGLPRPSGQRTSPRGAGYQPHDSGPPHAEQDVASRYRQDGRDPRRERAPLREPLDEALVPDRADDPFALVHPDPSVDLARVAAKKWLCRAASDHPPSRADLEEFARRYPEASGTLAGRKGAYATILAESIAQDHLETSGQPDGRWPTFAGSPEAAPDLQPVAYPTRRGTLAPVNLPVGTGPIWVMAVLPLVMLVLALREVDLSVGSLAALSGVLTAVVIGRTGSVALGVLAGLLAGGVVGFANGWVVARLKVNSLIVTLATMEIVRGLAFLVSGPLAGTLSDRFGTRGLATGGMLVFGASFVGLLLLPVDFPYWAFCLLTVANGIGMGLFSAPNSSSIMGSVPAAQRGAATTPAIGIIAGV